jgi:ribosomal protein L11 methylase PrmA
MFPCDAQEQARLDIFHKLGSQKLIYAPYPRNGRILDLGCGTGIWAIDAHQCPEAFIVGVDLLSMQPSNQPAKCNFYAPWDYESPFASLCKWAVYSWPNLYQKVFAHLHPSA